MTEDTGARALGHSTNLVGVPAGALASAAFNDAAPALRVAGVREENAHLFRMLERSASAEHAAVIFEHYMAVMFGLTPLPPPLDQQGRRRYRASYLRLLRGWAYDNNGAEGAVLKGWVESRFGLVPTYHKEKITRFASSAWIRYVEEKMASRFHNNAIYSQLDLLFANSRSGPCARPARARVICGCSAAFSTLPSTRSSSASTAGRSCCA
jgi:NAD+---dinitrogen-reductase ADP-D-ribosyltransferase